jgi:hypothetical protein
MAPLIYPSMDSCIPKYTKIKQGKDGDFAEAFKSIGILGLFSKKKSKQKVEEYFEKIGKTGDLEKVTEIDDYVIKMSKNPGYFGLRTITELKQEQKERRKQIRNMKEIERENNRRLLRERIYDGLSLVNVEKKIKYRFIPFLHEYEVTFDVAEGYDDLFKNATLKVGEEFVYNNLKRFEKEEKDPEKKMKLTGLRKLYGKKQELIALMEKNRKKKILTVGLAGMALAATAAGTLAYAINQNNNAVDEEGEYARSKGLSEEMIQRIQNADENNVLDAGEKTTIDFLATLDTHYQQKVVDAVYQDGILSPQEIGNMTFLGNLPEDVRNPIIERGDAANYDLEGDGIYNVDEQTLGMPWDVYNGRYFINLETRNSPGMLRKADYMHSFLTEEQKIPSENIKNLIYTDATKENLEKAVSEISQKTNKNDTVFIRLSAEGVKDYIVLNDGKGDFYLNEGMSYKNMDKLFDSIKSKTVIFISACQSKTALEPLKDGPAPRVVMTMPADWIFATSKKYPNDFMQAQAGQYDFIAPEDYDIDDNRYVSFRESYETMMKSMERYLSIHPEERNTTYGIIDSDNISGETYLGGFSVSD